MMSSYGGGRSAVCAECYREHCRPRRPAVPSVRTAAAAAPTEAVTPPDGRPRSRPCRRSDQALRDCQLFIGASRRRVSPPPKNVWGEGVAGIFFPRRILDVISRTKRD
ncbi:Hypothetical protein CINCED_3A018024 [Cinara cedri]|uniref:Uncharacterized protein n=1 Tax=Cinara cedri TaxID=506608 RepID=A0A5E4MP22_9HEMI|nr:Hypothetical protein CINCED_3A018024 [Cinara cedri]